MSFSHLATIGTLSYNGVTFDGASHIKVNVEFIRDEAERTVIYSRHTIEAQAYFSDASSTDSQLESIRSKLNHQGGALTFINKGFGDDLVVNAAGGGGLRDVKWGPKPETLYWEPVGAAGACEVIWKVSTCVPVCGRGASDRTSGVMALNYGVDIAIDERGLSTRTISGYIEIAQTRTAFMGIPDTADNYRFMIQPVIPDGFQRSNTWRISADKSRADFTITDRQLPTKNPYPAQVTNIRGNHRVSWSRGRRSLSKINSISLEVELALGAPAALAWQMFGQLVKSRVDYAARNGLTAFLDEVVSDEEIFGLSYAFGCSYRLLSNAGQAMNQGSQDFANLNPNIPQAVFDVAATGQWQPVGTDWNLWRTSLVNAGVFGSRGLALLTVPSTDIIVDLCGDAQQASFSKPQSSTSLVRATVPVLKNKKPPAHQSYLSYSQRVIVRREKYVARQKKKQQSRKPTATGDMMNPERASFGESQSQGDITSSAGDTLQESGTGSYRVAYVGSAERAGYEIPRPAVQSIA
ncbi:MAG: hypothetical protein ACREUY_04475 [Burkholderiales bacterium]